MSTVVFLCSILLVSACANNISGVDSLPEQMQTLTTSDGVKLAYSFVEAEGDKAVILLHMLNQHKGTWHDLPKKLQEAGYSSIALDFRGHGESEGDWQKFSDQDFQKLLNDAEAAKEFLENQGKTDISVIGGSIGANTAFNFATANPDVKTAILLAPGENFRGVGTLESAATFNSERHVLVVVAEDDSYIDTGNTLFEAITTQNKELKVYEEGGHGTRLLPVTNLGEVIVDWLEKYG